MIPPNRVPPVSTGLPDLRDYGLAFFFLYILL